MENNLPSVEDAIHSYKKFHFFEAFTDNELYHLKKLMQEYASLLVAQRDKEIEGLKEELGDFLHRPDEKPIAGGELYEIITFQYKKWCKETKRNGKILIGSMDEFFQYLCKSQAITGESEDKKQ